jgi:mycothiol synthase
LNPPPRKRGGFLAQAAWRNNVLGVRPGTQGGGLGKSLTTIGLRHLAAQGLPTAMLYVDADNKAAVSVYERLGFTTYETDLMYRTET